MRPFLAGMAAEEAGAYLAAYDAALAAAYPALPDGRVLFPFARVFFVLERS
jgi:trans-aconitate 2-methyltransferase